MTTLGIDETGRRFTLDGSACFLLGASYYGALGAPDGFVEADLSELNEHGFNWVRVWATWAYWGNNVSAVTPEGRPREPYLSQLEALCRIADEAGMVVDVTLSRGDGRVGTGLLNGQDGHMAAVTALAERLAPLRNVYFDLGNERDYEDARFVPVDELQELRAHLAEVDPTRLATGSHVGDIPTDSLEQDLHVVKLDFVTPHRPRNPESPGQTEEKTRDYLRRMEELGRVVPVHYQEPMRRSFMHWQPELEHFLADLRGAVRGGAAGWCLHNGGSRDVAEDGRPRRSFDMRTEEGRLFDQLDAVELEVVDRASEIVDEAATDPGPD